MFCGETGRINTNKVKGVTQPLPYVCMFGLCPLWRDKSFPIPEDGDVGDGGGEEEGAVAADRNHLRRVETHVARQLCKEM